MYYVYVLKSIFQNVFYKGLTDNLERRLFEHKNGKCPTSKRMNPWALVFVQVCESREEARSLEKYLKTGAGREIILEIC